MWTDEAIQRLSDGAVKLVRDGELEPWEAIAAVITTMSGPMPAAFEV